MKPKKRRKINQVILFWFLVITFSSCSLLTISIVQVQYRTFRNESKNFREQYIEEQKLFLRQRVVEAVEYVNYRSNKANTILKDNIKSRVYEAVSVAENLNSKYKNIMPRDDIASLIKETLRPIRFNQGRGYYFAVSLNGVEELYPTRPELEGKNLIDLQDITGKYVIKNEIKTVHESKEGFVSGHWPNPHIENDPGSLEYSFVKLFKPLNWYIGTGEFLNNVENDIKSEVLDWLSRIRFGQSSYIFAETNKGEALLMDGKIVQEPLDVWELEDPNGVKVIQEEIEIAQSNPKGGFLKYSWRKESGDTPIPVISFVRAIPQWEWIIGSSIYLDDLETNISLQAERMKLNVYKDIKKMIFFMLLCILIIFSISILISRRFNRELLIFSSIFSQGKEKNIEVPLEKLDIKEFYVLGEVANHMITKRKETEERLKQLSRTDPLTGLSNRRDMMEKMSLESKRSDRSGKSSALILIDIDHFKKINDTYGHDAGDVVLRGISTILRDEARLTDTTSRWGGEEFLLLLSDSNLEGAIATAEKFRKIVENKKFTYEHNIINVTLTSGVSICPKGMPPEKAISMADKALYQGKILGRNRVIALNNDLEEKKTK